MAKAAPMPMETMMQDTTAELKWRTPTINGDGPTKRSGHTISVVGTNSFIFGGSFVTPIHTFIPQLTHSRSVSLLALPIIIIIITTIRL